MTDYSYSKVGGFSIRVDWLGMYGSVGGRTFRYPNRVQRVTQNLTIGNTYNLAYDLRHSASVALNQTYLRIYIDGVKVKEFAPLSSSMAGTLSFAAEREPPPPKKAPPPQEPPNKPEEPETETPQVEPEQPGPEETRKPAAPGANKYRVLSPLRFQNIKGVQIPEVRYVSVRYLTAEEVNRYIAADYDVESVDSTFPLHGARPDPQSVINRSEALKKAGVQLDSIFTGPKPGPSRRTSVYGRPWAGAPTITPQIYQPPGGRRSTYHGGNIFA